MLLVLGKERLVWLRGQWTPQPQGSGLGQDAACWGRAWRQNWEQMGSLDELGVQPVRTLSQEALPGLGEEQGQDWEIIPKCKRRANCCRVCVISTHTWQLHSLLLFNIILSQYCPTWGFPEGPVFKTLQFQCKEHRFDPGSWSQKLKIKYIYIYIYPYIYIMRN